MRSIYAIGETVFDIIFSQNQPVAARPGGSMLNTAVSLGRCGLKVEMITELGDDKVGELVLGFLAENSVKATYTKPSAGLKTPVSLAFLDENADAQYSFYKNYPEERLPISWPEAQKGDVVLFGSFYSLDLAVRGKIIPFLKKARKNGALIIYDPNIRKNHLGEIKSMMHLVLENITMADIVRGSDEDFENLFGLRESEKVYERVKEAGCKVLVVTKGNHGAELFSNKIKLQAPAKEIEVVSTIGAGDAFNAGIIFGLLEAGLFVDDLVNIKQEAWGKILGFGINFAAEVCQSFDNYIVKSIKN
jgi:fructokinase